MRSSPSIFAQSPGSVPAAELQGPSNLESTDTGQTPSELPKPALGPRSRRESQSKSPQAAVVSRQELESIRETTLKTAQALKLEGVRQSKASKNPQDTQEKGWQEENSERQSEEAEKRTPTQPKRPNLSVPAVIKSGEHSISDTNIFKRTAESLSPLRRSKKPRLSRDDSDLLVAFDRHDFSHLDPGRPVSPLFFSNTPNSHHRAPRFDSGEAAARLLQITGMEDVGGANRSGGGSVSGSGSSGGGSMKTVRMARGSVGSMSPFGPTKAPSPHTSASQIRMGMSRSVSARGATPDVQAADERDKEALGIGLQLLSQAGVLELLDQDDRPTFVLDVSYKTNFQPGPLYISFVNSSLRAYGGLSEAIRGRGVGETPSFSPTPSFPEFKHWVTSFVSGSETMDVILPSFTFAGFVWRASTMKKRYRIVSGVLVNHLSLGMPSISTPGGSALSKVLSNGSIAQRDELGDYFGQGALPAVQENPKESPGEVRGTNGRSEAGGARLRTPDFSSTKVSDGMSGSATGDKDSEEVLKILTEIPSSISPDGYPMNASIDNRANEAIVRAASTGNVDWAALPNNSIANLTDPASDTPGSSQDYFDWTRLPHSASLPHHIQFARNIDWGSTSLGPIETWSGHLRAMSCLIMASPHPAAMYWGEDYVAIYNEPYILLAGQKHPSLMGTKYAVAWPEIWDAVKDSFAQAKNTGQSTMKDDDRLFINRSGFLEETYFSWSIIPLVGEDGSVVGLYNPAFEKTRRKIAERRMLTLREVGEKTAAAREVKSFWGAVLKALEYNEYDTPFVLLYSVSEDDHSESSSVHSSSIIGARQCVLEGTLPSLPSDHPAAPPLIDLKSGTEGFSTVFREAIMADKHIFLDTASGTLDGALLEDMEWRGFNEKPRSAVVCPIHPTTGDSIIGFLVMGINPRRPYDDDYNLFITLLTRQLATSMASVVLFEEEIRRGQRAAKLAALDRIELSQQLEARTQEARESETKFTRMAEFAPVGIFIANKDGDITFTNGVFHSLTHLPKNDSGERWIELVADEDKPKLEELWNGAVHNGLSGTREIRFKGEWKGNNDARGEIWVLCSVFAEKYPDNSPKSIFGSLTDISQQKWAEGIQIKRTREAIETKRQQSNFIDMTSHEMRNPLSAILQSADEISGSLIEYKNSKDPSQIPLELIESNIDAAQTISLCANHQTRIVSDVLTLSKLDSALLLVTPVDVQPRVIVQQAMKMFEGEMQTADIDLKVYVDKSIDDLEVDWVRLDPSRLLQVLINLMTNAIKFTTPEAHRCITVKLGASMEQPSKKPGACVDYIPGTTEHGKSTKGADWGTGDLIYLSFAVQDTGKGLNEEEKKLLFLRFSQASPKTHVRYGGSGLGLFISRELVELQGGEIGVSSETGKGSTFAFYVQARKSKAPKGDVEGELARNLAANGGFTGLLRKSSVTRSTKPNIGAASPSKLPTVPAENEGATTSSGVTVKSESKATPRFLNILIVEDNLVNQKVLAKQLRNIGYHVAVANHGEEALDHLRKTRYWKENAGKGDALELSVILMDLEMPIMDGLTCTRRIRELERAGELLGHSPIIAVSANARSAHIDSAMDAGMDDVVSKPFRIPELVPKMYQLVDEYRADTSTQK